MPPIRLSISKCCTLLAVSISFNREIMSPCSHYIKKGLVYITVINLFSRQPFSYIKCTKSNTCALYNMRLIFFNKYTFLYYVYYYAY